MAINRLSGSGNIFGQSGGNLNRFDDDSADAEWQIYGFLIKHFRLTELQARRTIMSVIDAGENLVELAQGIENDDDAVIGQIELYIP